MHRGNLGPGSPPEEQSKELLTHRTTQEYSTRKKDDIKHCGADLFKMVNGQPYLSLGIEHTAQVAPSHCKVGLSLNGFQVTSLQWVYKEKPQDRRRKGRMGEV